MSSCSHTNGLVGSLLASIVKFVEVVPGRVSGDVLVSPVDNVRHALKFSTIAALEMLAGELAEVWHGDPVRVSMTASSTDEQVLVGAGDKVFPLVAFAV